VQHTWKSAAHLEEYSTYRKMRQKLRYTRKINHTLKNALQKWVTFRKMRHTWKRAAHLNKCATLGKLRHIWQNAPDLEQCGTLKKIRRA